MKPQAVSQKQIARTVGFSQPLVSLVLNGRRDVVNEKSYRRIWDCAIKCGYRPKGMQINGSPVATKSVGCVVAGGLRALAQNGFFGHVLQGLHTTLAKPDYNTVLLSTDFFPSTQSLREKLKR